MKTLRRYLLAPHQQRMIRSAQPATSPHPQAPPPPRRAGMEEPRCRFASALRQQPPPLTAPVQLQQQPSRRTQLPPPVLTAGRGGLQPCGAGAAAATGTLPPAHCRPLPARPGPAAPSPRQGPPAAPPCRARRRRRSPRRRGEELALASAPRRGAVGGDCGPAGGGAAGAPSPT